MFLEKASLDPFRIYYSDCVLAYIRTSSEYLLSDHYVLSFCSLLFVFIKLVFVVIFLVFLEV